MKPAELPARIRIILADDHELVRSGIKALLCMIDRVEVIAEARDGEELITLVEALNPDLVFTDISMPRMDGIAAIAHLHASRPKVRIVVLSMYDTVDFVKRAVASGACGYVMKDAPPLELEQAVYAVITRDSYFSPAIASKLLMSAPATASDQLTPRQLEILKLLAQGLSSKEIGFQLGLSPKTVDVHRAAIMKRLEIADVASLTRYAIRNGLVDA
ncbi:MAG: response regulator transcription factor [Burkholderiaceae bacterium]|nr:response regulator transcription factor [Burkholderiaceae bacterium]